MGSTTAVGAGAPGGASATLAGRQDGSRGRSFVLSQPPSRGSRQRPRQFLSRRLAPSQRSRARLAVVTTWGRYLDWVERRQRQVHAVPDVRKVVPAVQTRRTLACVSTALGLGTLLAMVSVGDHSATSSAAALAGFLAASYLLMRLNRRSPMVLTPPMLIGMRDLPPPASVWNAVLPLVPLYVVSYAFIGASAAAHGPRAIGFVFVGVMLAGGPPQLDLARHGARVEGRYGGQLWQPASNRATAQGISYVVRSDA